MSDCFFQKKIRPFDLKIKKKSLDEELNYFRYYDINFEEKKSDVTHYFGMLDTNGIGIACHYFEHTHAKACCFIVHGYYDHSGLYKHLINYCLEHKFSVVIFDLPGHGLSSGARASIEHFSDYQLVLNTVITYFSSVINLPFYAIGQSTGAAILMDFLLSKPSLTFEKIILLAPLVRPINWSFSLFLYKLTKPFCSKIARRFAANSHDKKFLIFLKKDDPLQCRFLPLNWVGALKQWINYFLALEGNSNKLLVLQGKNDNTVDWRFNLKVIKEKFPNSKIVFIDKACHHLANESESIRLTYYKEMDNYLK